MLDATIHRDARRQIVRVRVPSALDAYATADRPSAADAGVGAAYYDTTLSKPGWSDGTDWRDAAGTII